MPQRMGHAACCSILWIIAVGGAAAQPVPPGASAAEDEPPPRPSQLLRRLANVAKLYQDNALRFTCDETIHYTGHGAPALYKFRYLYLYSEEGQALRDYRVPRSRRSDDAVELANYGLPVFLLRAYSWVFIFLEEIQPTFDFRVEGEEELLGRPAIRLSFEPIPPIRSNINDWYGTAWIDRESHQLLLVEAERPEDREERRKMANALRRTTDRTETNYRGTYTIITYRTLFDVEKNGMRFPGRTDIQRVDHVIFGTTSEGRVTEEPVFHVSQTYRKYRFFSVRTAAEIRRIVEAAD